MVLAPFGIHPLWLLLTAPFWAVVGLAVFLLSRQRSTPQQGAFSADGKWWWDGREWRPAISDDGHWRWTGTAWVRTGR